MVSLKETRCLTSTHLWWPEEQVKPAGNRLNTFWHALCSRSAEESVRVCTDEASHGLHGLTHLLRFSFNGLNRLCSVKMERRCSSQKAERGRERETQVCHVYKFRESRKVQESGEMGSEGRSVVQLISSISSPKVEKSLMWHCSSLVLLLKSRVQTCMTSTIMLLNACLFFPSLQVKVVMHISKNGFGGRGFYQVSH